MKLEFKISQHSRDADFLKSLVSYLGCGNYHPFSNYAACEFVVTGILDISNKIIPFFKNYQIIGEKSKYFSDFCKLTDLINNKDHLTPEGLEHIRKIKVSPPPRPGGGVGNVAAAAV